MGRRDNNKRHTSIPRTCGLCFTSSLSLLCASWEGCARHIRPSWCCHARGKRCRWPRIRRTQQSSRQVDGLDCDPASTEQLIGNGFPIFSDDYHSTWCIFQNEYVTSDVKSENSFSLMLAHVLLLKASTGVFLRGLDERYSFHVDEVAQIF